MTDRFEALKKIPKQPALRFLALSGLKLETKLDAPAAAPVDTVLEELEKKKAPLDMLRLVAAALPAREAIWWACLAAEDICAADGVPDTPSLVAARDWVLKPTEENRKAARAALEALDLDDDTGPCAQAVLMHDGTLGPGDLSGFEAPRGAVPISAFSMNLMALQRVDPDKFFARLDALIDRALDIARGGNGRFDGAGQGERNSEVPG